VKEEKMEVAEVWEVVLKGRGQEALERSRKTKEVDDLDGLLPPGKESDASADRGKVAILEG
jgi:hypothetical protein